MDTRFSPPGSPTSPSTRPNSQPAGGPTGHRAAAVAGVTGAVLLFVGVASTNTPRAATDTVLTAWWADPANQRAYVLSTFALLGSGLAFLVFITYLQGRLRAVAPSSLATAVVGASGWVFVTMTFLAGVSGALARGPIIDGEPVAGADLLRYLPQIRYTAMGAFALPAVALMIAAVSYVVLRHGGLPAWTGWLGGVSVLVIVAATATFRGQLAIPVLLLWALCVAVTLVVRPVPLVRHSSTQA